MTIRLLVLASFAVLCLTQCATSPEKEAWERAAILDQRLSREWTIVTPESATVCTNLKIIPDGAVHVAGKSHTEANDPPSAWEYLIPR